MRKELLESIYKSRGRSKKQENDGSGGEQINRLPATLLLDKVQKEANRSPDLICAGREASTSFKRNIVFAYLCFAASSLGCGRRDLFTALQGLLSSWQAQ